MFCHLYAQTSFKEQTNVCVGYKQFLRLAHESPPRPHMPHLEVNSRFSDLCEYATYCEHGIRHGRAPAHPHVV